MASYYYALLGLIFAYVLLWKGAYLGDLYLEDVPADMVMMGVVNPPRPGFSSSDPKDFDYCVRPWKNEYEYEEPVQCYYASGHDICQISNGFIFARTRRNIQTRQQDAADKQWKWKAARNEITVDFEQFTLGFFFELFTTGTMIGSSEKIQGHLEVPLDPLRSGNGSLQHAICKEHENATETADSDRKTDRAPCYLPVGGMGSEWQQEMDLKTWMGAAGIDLSNKWKSYPMWELRDIGAVIVVNIDYDNRRPFQLLPGELFYTLRLQAFPGAWGRMKSTTRIDEKTQEVFTDYGITFRFLSQNGTYRQLSLSRFVTMLGASAGLVSIAMAILLNAAKYGFFGETVRRAAEAQTASISGSPQGIELSSHIH